MVFLKIINQRIIILLCVFLFGIVLLKISVPNEDAIEFDDQENLFSNDRREKRSLSPLTTILNTIIQKNDIPRAIGCLFDILRDDYPLPSGLKSPYDEYDFVIVGAGAAGCALASRLSENEEWSVLLIEAGGPESVINDVPLLAATLQHTDYNWGYRMERNANLCLAMENQQCNWPRGKAIGGSSTINYMIYTRGNKRDWDRIAADGNPGWSYGDVLPFFLKSERANLKSFKGSPYHNPEGLMSVEDIAHRTPLVEAFLEAGKELGHKFVDYNQENEFGFSYVQAQTLNGKRFSAAKAFLHPFKKRPNLHILSHTRATKIVINKHTKTAESVEYVRNRKTYNVRAKREIILSSGTFGSAQLLMLSGVGPEQHLQDLDIEVIKDLKVGENMYDHMGYPGHVFLINQTGISLTEKSIINLKNTAEWIKYGEGPISTIGGVEALGYIKTKISDETVDYPDIELIFAPGGLTADRSSTIRKGMKITDEFFNDVYGDIVGMDAWTIFPMLVHPRSKGRVRLADKNPFHWPKLHYDYFSDERDMKTMIEGIKYAIKLSETKAFQKYGSRHHDKRFPGCRRHSFGTDEYWECAIRHLGTTLHHQIATCKMGPATDPEAVVDHRLKVHGIRRLRVADTSIIPRPITAHTNAPAVMIGEKLSDMIKEEYNFKQ